MEKCNFQGTEIDLPIDLIENPEIFSHVMSLDTWKHVLTPENRNHLKNYLPVLPTDYPHAQQENLRALFDGENFKFGNPLQTFERKLQAGYYASGIVKYRKRCKSAKHKEYKLKLKKFYRKLMNDILISRQEIIDHVLCTSHQEVPITLSWHERQMHKSSSLTGNLETKYKKIMKEVKDECEDLSVSSDEEPSDLSPHQQSLFNGENHSETFNSSGGRDFLMSTASTSSSAQPSVTEEDYQRMLRTHKRKRDNREDCPDLDTRIISLEDVISRTNVTTKKVSKTVVKNKGKVKEKKEHTRKLKKKRNVPSVVSEQPTVPAVSVDNEEQVAPQVNVQEDNGSIQSFKYLENSSVCFFSLLRDIFLDLPDVTADLQQIERMVKEWQKSSSCSANSWSFKEPNWVDLIPSALKFLAGSSKASFLPLVIFKQKVHHWKWIGAYRDDDGELVPLCEHWFKTKDDATNTSEPPVAAPEASLTDYVVGPSTSDEKSDYQNQERQRYENPHKPFIYQMHGFDSIVAPVKGVFTKESNLNKAREHSLLVSKRPPYVTILTLVRDAAARLPNGEGTRAEVCQLLKDSQYINPDATDGQIHTVVSGALDRLHYEKDPCVKYDSARKVWIYLHKTRSVEEFEKIHEASAAAARAKKQMSQKQKLMKQQQKAKETAMSISNVSQSSSAVEEGDGVVDAEAAAIVLPETLPIAVPSPVPAPKPKKAKAKRPAANPKKTDKSKVNTKKGSLEIVIPTQPGISPPPHFEGAGLSSLPPATNLPNASAVDFRDHQEQSLFHPQNNNSAFSRTSRLNSPFMGAPQPVLDNAPFGNQNANYGLTLEGGFEKPQAGGESSSSSSESESESESGSSSSNEVTGQRLAVSEHRDGSLLFGEPRMPLNSVMSLGQGNPNGAESDNTFARYY